MRIISDPESRYFSELPARSYWRTMRKIYLMIRENQPRAVLHPRKDITLRELVVSSHEDGKITDQQKADYLKNVMSFMIFGTSTGNPQTEKPDA